MASAVVLLNALILNASCEYILKNPSKNTSQIRVNPAETSPKNKVVTEVFYVDNGAIVPRPTISTVHFILKDSLNALFTFNAISFSDSVVNKMKISPDRIALLNEQIEALANVEDGEELKQGKKPCVGMRSVDVNVVYNTGDTTRFRISGGARCDATILPAWHQMDSLAKILNQESTAAPQ